MWSLRSQEFKTNATLNEGKEMTVQINLKTLVTLLPRSLGPVDEGLANIPDLEDGRRLHVVPVLARERVNNLLLGAFLAGLQALQRKK